MRRCSVGTRRSGGISRCIPPVCAYVHESHELYDATRKSQTSTNSVAYLTPLIRVTEMGSREWQRKSELQSQVFLFVVLCFAVKNVRNCKKL